MQVQQPDLLQDRFDSRVMKRTQHNSSTRFVEMLQNKLHVLGYCSMPDQETEEKETGAWPGYNTVLGNILYK